VQTIKGCSVTIREVQVLRCCLDYLIFALIKAT
jgi:hypothetical protein